MKQQTFLHRLETLGYYTQPRSHPKSPGFIGLLALLRQAPQGHEPEAIQLCLHEWNGKTTMERFHADMNFEPLSHVICPGRISIRSRQEREATFYTFGGTINSEALAGEAVFFLHSAAPVLELISEQETIADWLAEETEALFSRIKAQQQLSSQELLDRLVKAGSEAVYLAVLQSLLTVGADTTVSHPYRNDFFTMLKRERNWYQEARRWPLLTRDLATLVQKVGEA